MLAMHILLWLGRDGNLDAAQPVTLPQEMTPKALTGRLCLLRQHCHEATEAPYAAILQMHARINIDTATSWTVPKQLHILQPSSLEVTACNRGPTPAQAAQTGVLGLLSADAEGPRHLSAHTI